MPSPDVFERALIEAGREADRREEAFEVELQSPEAEQERESSRDAFALLSSAEAQGLLAAEFPQVLRNLDADPARALSTLRIEDPLGTYVARVSGGDGGSQLVESSIPIEIGANGNRDPVDLALQRAGDGFVPRNPLTAVELPVSSAGRIQLPSGVTVALAGGATVNAHRFGEMDLFYPATARSTDTLVAPRTYGAEVFEQLRSSDSPEQFRYELSLPDGATVRADGRDGAEVIDADGEKLVAIPAPAAVDAQGSEVPVTLTVEGSSLLVSIDHRSTDLAYPVLVDPELVDYVGPGSAGFGFWDPQYNGPFDLDKNGALHAHSRGKGTSYGAGNYGQFVFWAPGSTAFIRRAGFSGISLIVPGNCAAETQPHGYVGIFNLATGKYQPIPFEYEQSISNASLDTGYSGDGNVRLAAAGIGTHVAKNPPCARDFYVGGVTLYFDDPEAPGLGAPSGPGGPVGTTALPITISASDPGFGVRLIKTQTLGSDGQTKTWVNVVGGGCTGLRQSPCPPGVSGASVIYDPSVMPEGNRTLTITAEDPAGHVSAPQFASVTVDRTAPDTVIDTGPAHESGIAGTNATFTYHSTEPGSSFECKLDSAAFSPCSAAGFTTPTLADGAHTFSVRAKDGVGNADGSPASRTFHVGPPDTVIDSGPQGPTNDATPSFAYHATQPGATFSCSLDGGPFASCPATGFAAPILPDGPHAFAVKATSFAGLTDPTPATRSFEVDTIVPDTTIDFGPSNPTGVSTPSFGYSSDDQEAGFECRIDGAAFERCPDTELEVEVPLGDGSHTFVVRAKDPAGNVDPTPATQTFTIDTDPPKVEIKSGPAGPTNDPTPSFTFVASGGSLACAIDSDLAAIEEPGYGPCGTSSSHTAGAPLPDGPYTFHVRATDVAENEAADTRSFTVDTVPPDTTIDSGPSGTTDDLRPAFSFSSSEPRSGFRCRFDSDEFDVCSGPGATHVPKTPLANGGHVFEVLAVDPAGNKDATPAARSFVVDATGPQTTIDTGPEGAIAQTTTTFKYSADEPASFQCRLDGAKFSSCPVAGLTLSKLSEGEHRFEVRAVNSFAKFDPTPAGRSFIVDTSEPEPPIPGGPLYDLGTPGLSLSLHLKDGDSSSPSTIRSGVKALRIYVDGELVTEEDESCTEPLGTCPDTVQREIQLPYQSVLGPHVYRVESEDGVGHVSVVAEWKKDVPLEGTLEPVEATASQEAPCDGKGLNVIEVKKGKPVVRGTKESDLIVSKPGVKVIKGGRGCDVILGGPSQEHIRGGAGDDFIRARRSNDFVYGDGDDDLIYGGIGDDKLSGGAGDDLIDGGPGADREKGMAGSDTVRGGQGEDKLSGGAGPGTDTASFADAIAPGFTNNGKSKVLKELKDRVNVGGFPDEAESGVHVNLNSSPPTVDNGKTGAGGGTDVLTGKDRGGFEHIVGSAFSDLIERSADQPTIQAGPGADVILGGGPTGVDGGSGDNFIEGDPERAIAARDRSKIELGIQLPGAQGAESDLYFAGSKETDEVEVSYDRGANKVSFTAKTADTASRFPKKSECGRSGRTISCKLTSRLGSVVIFGGNKADHLSIGTEAPKGPGAFELLGGPDKDQLSGGVLEELLADGEKQGKGSPEKLRGGGGDDVVIQGDGGDHVQGNSGNDLLISSQICNGDQIVGDNGKKDLGSDNAQFHPLKEVGVFADLEDGQLGQVKKPGNKCGGTHFETLSEINDLESSPQRDILKGSADSNLLIGRGDKDSMFGRDGRDTLNAKDDAIDARVDCGGQKGDKARYDANVSGRSENDAGVIFDCPVRTSKGVTYRSRPALLREEGSEPPILGGFGDSFRESTDVLTYYPLDESSGVAVASGAEGVQAGTYRSLGFGPSSNGPGPLLGVASALLEEDEGSAAKLDGVDDYIDLAGQGGSDEGEEPGYSVAMFVKFSRPPGAQEYVFSSSQAGKGIFLFRNASGKLVFTTGVAKGAPRVTAAEPIQDGAWHQVVGTLEGSTMVLNVDGFTYRLGYGKNVLPKVGSLPESLIGAGPNVSHLLAGVVDEFVSWDGALGESEIFAQLAESEVEEPEFLLAPPAETSDIDADGVTDGADNCPETSNADQEDEDVNGIGDACEPPDADGDDVPDTDDNCPNAYNPEQEDGDGDAVGDECALLPPVATTDAASQVKRTSATLNATVTPGGTDTGYQFEYGTSASYGTSIPLAPQSIGTGSAPVAVSQSIAGLQPGTTYHYRVVATNEGGQGEGADETFTTLDLPTAVTGAATAITDASATLTATVNPSGADTSYQFEYGKTTAYGTAVPASPKSLGAGTTEVQVGEAIAGLEAETTYHYRVVATSEGFTIRGKDKTFATASPPVDGAKLAAMAVTEPFTGSGVASRFASGWSALPWTQSKGFGTSSGWRPLTSLPEVGGASYNPVLTDTGRGLAAVTSLFESSVSANDYVSLWLDVPMGASSRSGYELRFTTPEWATYEVTLARWQSGVRTILASQPGFSFENDQKFALVDQGGTISAWTAGGAGFSQLLSAEDSAFSGGMAALEGTGTSTRLVDFKFGVPQSAATGMDSALKALQLQDDFSADEIPLSGAGAWAALAWDESALGYKTGQVSGGWGPADAFPATNGAFWQKAGFADTGSGDAVSAVLARNPSITERHFSLWLNMPGPSGVRSGYELRFTETATGIYSVGLSRWAAGAQTLLASQAGYSLPIGSRFALVRKAGVVSAWTDTGTGYTQILSASDPSFISGYSGIDAAGNITRLREFRSGPIPPF